MRGFFALGRVARGANLVGVFLSIIDFDEGRLRELIGYLLEDGFQPYTTAVGGSGLGVLSPYAQPARAPATPPESPAEREDAGVLRDEGVRGAFEAKSVDELASWAENLGRWMYV